MKNILFIGLALYLLSNKKGIGAIEKTKFNAPYTNRKTNFSNAKNKSGVYIIKKENEVVYVGHSKSNLYKTLYRHFQEWNHPYQKVTTYSQRQNYKVRIIFTTPEQAVRLEAYLVNKYKPVDNDHKLIKYDDSKTGKKEYQKMMEAAPF